MFNLDVVRGYLASFSTIFRLNFETVLTAILFLFLFDFFHFSSDTSSYGNKLAQMKVGFFGTNVER